MSDIPINRITKIDGKLFVRLGNGEVLVWRKKIRYRWFKRINLGFWDRAREEDL